MIAKHMAQRLMQKMRCRMIRPQTAAAVMIDFHAQACIDGQCAFAYLGAMNEHAGRRLECVQDISAATIPHKAANIPLLATRFGVEGRLVGDDRHIPACHGIHGRTINNKRCYLPLGCLGGVAQKFGAAQLVA